MSPNKYLIYLYDTPAKDLCSQTQGIKSSQIVRVENTIGLSAYIVENRPEWKKERIEEIIEFGETTTTKVNRPIQVHHLYWSAWRAGNETVIINDVYDLDEQIYTKLAAN